MISISNILLIAWIHFIADFMLQNDEMAINKSSSSYWLTVHSLIYSVPFIFFGFKAMVIIFVSHWFVDFFTSRWTTKLWLKQQRHWFFVVIGFDQVVHLTFLILTIKFYS